MENVLVISAGVPFSVEDIFFENMEQGGSRKINCRMSGIQKLFRHAVGEIGFADAGVSVEKEIFKLCVKGFDEIQAFADGMFCRVKAGQSGGRVRLFPGIIIIRKVLKILCIQNLTDIGLRIDQVDRSLLETMAFLSADIAGVLTVGAAIRRIKIMFRIAVRC